MQGRSGLALGSADFVVTVGFGSPPQAMSVIFDSGSDLTWIQCKPCFSCYTQKEPLFDPSKSSDYSLLSCDSGYCSSSSPICDEFGHCKYTVTYGDGSQTLGLLSRDTLTLTSSYVLADFVFGCGDDNSGLFGEVAGIIGLGRDHISLPSQVNGTGAFSYCLPPYASSTGYLALGTSNGSRPNSPKNLHFTSLLSQFDAPSFYFVELVGISVGGKDLRIYPTSFSDPGTFIDSGTVLTYLPADAYAALRSEFRWWMRKYPMSAGVDPLDTCYDLKGYDRVAVPAVVLHFSGGARLDVDGSGILFTLDSSSAIACLAFAEKDPNGFSIIGNMQQKTCNIVYDVPNGKIGFGAGGCTADPF